MNQQPSPTDQIWMSRCFDLARQGVGYVSPNPPVGAILVYQDRILSEGYHGSFGGPHAEVAAVSNVAPGDRHLISKSTLYVSLEPCCNTGKTPPCTELILREGIMDVRISTLDPNPNVAGMGAEQLKANGVQVTTGILENEGKELIRSFTTNILLHRPHIILKWAQSKLGYTGVAKEQIWLSQPTTKTWSHHQRAQVDAILVGARTIEVDDPSLTVRDFPGRSPHRVVLDPNARLHDQYQVFRNDGCRVFYFSNHENAGIAGDHITKYTFTPGEDSISQLLQILYKENIGVLLVEGGAYTQKQFILHRLWDEAWVIQTQHPLDHGISAPNVRGRLLSKLDLDPDRIIGIACDVKV